MVGRQVVRILIDTHAFLWWLDGGERLSDGARSLIADPGNEILISAASVWEIVAKHRKGKLPEVAPLVGNLPRVIRRERFEPLAVTDEHAELAGMLPGDHADPFDRMLAAQAEIERIRLVSADRRIDALTDRRIW